MTIMTGMPDFGFFKSGVKWGKFLAVGPASLLLLVQCFGLVADPAFRESGFRGRGLLFHA